jgi:hypothetical protein
MKYLVLCYVMSASLRASVNVHKDNIEMPVIEFRTTVKNLVSFMLVDHRPINVKLSPCIIKQQAKKTHKGVEVLLHAFLNSALHTAKWSVLCSDRFTLRKDFLIKKLSEPQNRSGCGGENKNSLPCLESKPGCSIRKTDRATPVHEYVYKTINMYFVQYLIMIISISSFQTTALMSLFKGTQQRHNLSLSS